MGNQDTVLCCNKGPHKNFEVLTYALMYAEVYAIFVIVPSPYHYLETCPNYYICLCLGLLRGNISLIFGIRIQIPYRVKEE